MIATLMIVDYIIILYCRVNMLITPQGAGAQLIPRDLVSWALPRLRTKDNSAPCLSFPLAEASSRVLRSSLFFQSCIKRSPRKRKTAFSFSLFQAPTLRRRSTLKNNVLVMYANLFNLCLCITSMLFLF